METLCARECMPESRVASVVANLPATNRTSMFCLFKSSFRSKK